MKKPIVKLIIGLIILFLLSVAFRSFLLRVGPNVNIEYDLEQKSTQMKALINALNRELDLYADVTIRTYERALERVILPAATLSEEMEDGWDGKPRMYKKGAVIKVSDGNVEYPKEFPKEIEISAGELSGDKGVVYVNLENAEEIQDKNAYVVYYFKVKDPFHL